MSIGPVSFRNVGVGSAPIAPAQSQALEIDQEEKAEEICQFYRETCAFTSLHDYLVERIALHPDKIEYRYGLAKVQLQFGSMGDAFLTLKEAVCTFDPQASNFGEFMNAVSLLCRVGHAAKLDDELLSLLDRLRPQFGPRGHLLVNLKGECQRKRDLLRSFDDPAVVKKALALLNRVYKNSQRYRGLSRVEQDLVGELFVYGARNSVLIEQLQQKKPISYAESLFLSYLLQVEGEAFEKSACLVMRLKQCYKLWELGTTPKELWQRGLLGEAAPCWVASALDFDQLVHLRALFGKTIFSTLGASSPFSDLLKRCNQAGELMDALEERLLPHYESGDIGFLNLAKTKRYFNHTEAPCWARLRTEAILSLLGPQGHASVIDTSEGALRLSEVNEKEYRDRSVTLTRLLFYDFYRVNVSKQLTEEGKRLLGVHEATKRKLQDTFALAVDEILSPGDTETARDDDEIDDPLFSLLRQGLERPGSKRKGRPHFSSLWNSTRICVLAAFKAFFPYRVPQERQVELTGGMICSEFAARLDYKALELAEARIKESLAEQGALLESTRLIKPLVPDFVSLHLIVSANLVRYASEGLESRPKPPLFRALFDAPEDFWAS